jgi:chromosome condensin MukBEF MukE localization factor
MKKMKHSVCTTKNKDGFGLVRITLMTAIPASHIYSIIPKLKIKVLCFTYMNPEIFIHMKPMRLFQKPNDQQIITKKTCISKIFVKL